MKTWWIWSAAVLAAGCVSSGTWSAIDDVERELARAPEPERAGVVEGSVVRASSCDALVAHVVASHPALDALRSRARAALSEARAEGALPAPELMLEVWDFPIGEPSQADREGMYMVGLAQTLPPGGALDARARAAAEEAREALAELSERRREIRAEAAHACTDWAEARAIDERLASAEELLARMADALEARLATGGSTLSDVARLEAERAQLRRERAEVEARRERAEARLAAWAGETELALDEAPALPAVAMELDRGAMLDRALERARQVRGVLEGARARARAAAARADAAEAEASVPMFRIAANYMQMPSARAGLGASFSMTLPWLWSGEGAMRDAARARAEAELEGVQGIERDLRVEIAGALAELEVARRALARLREDERPAIERALAAIAVTYASGGADLLMWLDAARALRELEIEEARLGAEAAHAWVELESAVGEPLEESR